MTQYAIIRESDYLRRDDEQPPAYVMLVEKETDASLMGQILGDEGTPTNWTRAFDTKPASKRIGWGSNAKWEITRPGRVRKERLMTRHASFDDAKAALDLAQAAWWATEDRVADREACTAFSEANQRFEAEKKRLEDEMRERLASLQSEVYAAKTAMHRARADMYAKQSAAAIEAASISLPSTTSPQE